MQKTLVFFLANVLVTQGFAASFVLDNQVAKHTNNRKSKIAIQWATSGKQVEKNNTLLKLGKALDPHSLQALTQIGKLKLTIPQKAEYFRVLLWTNGTKSPDFLTNWVDIEPNKTYTLDEGHLIPFVLMIGMGC